MDVILMLSTFWVIYGIAGILGFQIIRSEYRGHRWTKTYVRLLGVSWLLLGVRSDSGVYGCEYRDRFTLHHFACAGHAVHCVYVFYRQKIQKHPEKRVKRHRLMFHEAVFL